MGCRTINIYVTLRHEGKSVGSDAARVEYYNSWRRQPERTKLLIFVRAPVERV